MPSLTSRKRGRDEAELDANIHLAFPQGFRHHHFPHSPPYHATPPRKPIAFPSPMAKKIRMAAAENEWFGDQPQHRQAAPLMPSSRHNRSPSANARNSPPKQATPTNLSPCHICHRKPTKKAELDSYADCEGCGERTCYVCIRECLGWKGTSALPTPTVQTYDESDDNAMQDDHYERRPDADDDQDNRKCSGSDQSFSMEDAPPNEEDGRDDDHARGDKRGIWGQGGGRGHRGKVCSQCCVEEGPEGEVICLGCLGT